MFETIKYTSIITDGRILKGGILTYLPIHQTIIKASLDVKLNAKRR